MRSWTSYPQPGSARLWNRCCERDIPASIKARLLHLAGAAREEFQLYLVRYASERFLYRLGVSGFRERCILKGAGLLSLWMRDPYRATRDLDFLATCPNDEHSIRELMASVCSVECFEDGVTFALGTLDVTPIRAEHEYRGQRARVTALLGKARIRIQVDFGFGDAVVPAPEDCEYPTLLRGMPAPQVRVYRREVSVAEKFEAMVKLGRRNSRMKDFHDVWALSSAFTFEGMDLRQAMEACLAHRRASLTEAPEALRPHFYKEAKLCGAWTAYLRRGAFSTSPPQAFELVGQRVIGFLGPVCASIVTGSDFEDAWPAGGPWRPR